MPNLYRVVYHSTNLVNGDKTDQNKQIKAILACSAVNNALCEVTGALLSSGPLFAQVLEGPEPDVLQTLERIRTDHRHHDLIILQSKPVFRRAFPDHAMAYVNAARSVHPLLPRLIRRDQDLPLMTGWLVNLLRDLVTASERSAVKVDRPYGDRRPTFLWTSSSYRDLLPALSNRIG